MTRGNRLKSGLINSAARVLAMLIILLSLYIIVGRQMVTLIGDYRSEVQQNVSELLGVEVEIGHLSGVWEGFGPKVIIEQVRIGQEFEIGSIELAPAVLSSFIQGRFVASNIEFSNIRVIVTKISADSGWSLSDWVVRPADLQASDAADITVKQVFDRLQPLFIQDHLELSNLAVILAVGDTEPLIVQIEHAWLESLYDVKKLSMDGWIFSGKQSANISLIAELDQWLEAPAGRVYLSQAYFDWSEWTRFLPESVGLSRLSTDLEAWLTLDAGVVVDVSSRLDIPEVELTRDNRQLAVQNIHTELTAHISEAATVAWLNNLSFEYLGNQWQDSLHQLNFSPQGIELLSDRLDVGLLSALGEIVTDNRVLKALTPQGQLLNSRVFWNTDAAAENPLLIQGRFKYAEIQPWLGIPGLQGLSGFIDMTAAGGYLQILPSDAWIDLPKVFDAPVNIKETSGGLNWRWSLERGLALASQNLRTRIDGVDDIEFAFSVLAPPRDVWAVREPRFEFHLEFDQTNQDMLSTFLPLSMNLESREWILGSVGQADISNGNLTLSLPTIKTSPMASTVLLDVDIDNGNISFLPEWADITDVSAHFNLENNHLAMVVDQAQHQGLQLQSGTVDMALAADATIKMAFNAIGDSADALSLLTGSPIRNYVGNSFDQWVIPEGKVDAQVRLEVPLDKRSVQAEVQAQVSKTALILPEYELAMSDVNGSILWSDATGIVAQDVRAQFYGQPTRIEVASEGDNFTDVRVGLTGAANLQDVGVWLDDALLRTLDQVADYQADILIQPDTVTIGVTSDLEGVAIPYPYPLSKAAHDAWPLEVQVTMDATDNTVISGRLRNQFSAAFFVKDGIIDRGLLTTDPKAEMPKEPGVFVDMVVDTIDGDAWQLQIEQWIALYDAYVPTSPTGGPRFDTLIQEVTINSSEFIFFNESWNRAELLVSRAGDGWIASYEAKEIQGTFGWGHEKDATMVVDIDFVSLQSAAPIDGDEDELPSDPLADYDPRTIPAAIVQVKRVTLDGKDLGEWSATLTPIADGIKIGKVQGRITGVATTGDIHWRYTPTGPVTQLTADAKLGNIGDVLAAWEKTSDVRTQSGRIQTAMSWPGSPLGYEAKSLEGDINLSFNDGAIINVGQEYESLKLLSILNPAMLMRRLAFDFNDVVKEGIGFDTVTGTLTFKDARLVLSKPIVLDGPSTKVQLGGNYDFTKDLMDFEMVFTIPLTNAIPIAALIAGLSPQVAVAMFVTERLLNNELSKFTSAKYVISGTSKAPQFKLLRAFDNALTAPKTQ